MNFATISFKLFAFSVFAGNSSNDISKKASLALLLHNTAKNEKRWEIFRKEMRLSKMKKQALSIILALVLLLSNSSFPVFAQEINVSDVVDYFGIVEDWTTTDLSVAGVDSEGIDLSAFEPKSGDEVVLEPEVVAEPSEFVSKSVLNAAAAAGTGSYVPCGNGKITIELAIEKDPAIPEGVGGNAKNAIFVKSIVIKNVAGDPGPTATYDLQECSVCEGGGKVLLDANGKAIIRGTIMVPMIYPIAPGNITYVADLVYAKGKEAAPEPVVTINGTATPTASHFCPTNSLTVSSTKGTYEECGGKASFKVDVVVPDTDGPKFVVPSEIYVNKTVYTEYVCRYTLFGSSGYPFGGDYCAPGYQVPLKPGQRIRFEALIEDLVNPISETSSGLQLDVVWRLGANGAMITGKMDSVAGNPKACDAKIVPLAPLEKNPPLVNEKAIKPSGWYGTYENAVVGLYQKCGRFAVMQIRLRNDGGKTGYVSLPGGVTVNGGTPISYYWLSSTEPEDGKVAIAPGEVVTLLGRLWLTNIPSQLNSNGPVNVSVNLPDHNLFMNGKLHSDKVNWRCY